MIRSWIFDDVMEELNSPFTLAKCVSVLWKNCIHIDGCRDFQLAWREYCWFLVQFN